MVIPTGELRFPLKADYDRVNTSLFDQSVVECDENAISMAHPFDGPGRGLSIWPREEPLLEPEHEILEAQTDDLDSVVEVVEEDPDIIAARAQEEADNLFKRNNLPHVRTGTADAKVIYVNNLGQRVRLDRRGGMCQCDLDGFRNTRKSGRPEGM